MVRVQWSPISSISSPYLTFLQPRSQGLSLLAPKSGRGERDPGNEVDFSFGQHQELELCPGPISEHAQCAHFQSSANQPREKRALGTRFLFPLIALLRLG